MKNRSGEPSHSMYYVAIVCPEEVNERVHEYKIRMRDRFGCTAALKSPAHITLIPPFWHSTEKENALVDALQRFHSGTGTLSVGLNGFGHFGKRVLFVAVEENAGLAQIQKETELHFRSFFPDVIKREKRPFHPHVTIATRDMKPSHFFEAWEYFSSKNMKMYFTVSRISLLKLVKGRWQIFIEKDWNVKSAF
ncbi:MAG: 2'-5' RNA ligase family protein [Chitinophagaceae bacterium]|nr:2'-5' RNA ligase family protein [Chitinophagaceae bacterium]